MFKYICARVSLLLFTLLLPVLTFAIPDDGNRGVTYLGEVDTFVNRISNFISDKLIPLVFGVALLVFLWGMFQYFIVGGGSEESQTKGKQLMLWSIIGFVVMVSIWGIVGMISGGLFPNQGPPTMPSSLSR